MSTITTRTAKGTALTWAEIDYNFTNLNTDKYQEGSAIGAVTPAAGTFTTLIGGKDKANYGQLTGGATTKAVEFKTLGSDTNVALALRSQGTGAIDLAAGSSGVNISNGGTVTAITRTAGGTGYTSAPTVTISAPTTAGGVQATATCTITGGVVHPTITITNAGSGYVEQPTVSFSGGGGSGAAAYATVGSIPKVQTLGSSLQVFTPAGVGFEFLDSSAPTTAYIQTVSGGSGQNGAYLRSNGTSSNPNLYFQTKGIGEFSFFTNALSSPSRQLQVAHTASAVNYVQVTGAATGSGPTISAQGSNADIDFNIAPKGTNGRVRFGTYTANMALTVQGYIEIKDSGGTVRKLAVIA